MYDKFQEKDDTMQQMMVYYKIPVQRKRNQGEIVSG